MATAVQLTAPLPMSLPRARRKLSRNECQLLSRAIDAAWGCHKLPLSAPEYVMLIETRGKRAAAVGHRARFSAGEKQLLIRLIDALWLRASAPLNEAELAELTRLPHKLSLQNGRRTR